jgi:hypothetical protein
MEVGEFSCEAVKQTLNSYSWGVILENEKYIEEYVMPSLRSIYLNGWGKGTNCTK